jgi:hypothetical protein
MYETAKIVSVSAISVKTTCHHGGCQPCGSGGRTVPMAFSA